MESATTLRVVMFQEGDFWVAQCLEHDIGAQARSLDELQKRFELTIKAEATHTLEATGAPFHGIDPAPKYFHDLWDRFQDPFKRIGQAEIPVDDGPSSHVRIDVGTQHNDRLLPTTIARLDRRLGVKSPWFPVDVGDDD